MAVGAVPCLWSVGWVWGLTCGLVGLLGVLWFIGPGHALVYGPHLFLFEIWDRITWPLRAKTRPPEADFRKSD